MSVDIYSLQVFIFCFITFANRTNDRDNESCFFKSRGFLPDSSIKWQWKIFNNDQDLFFTIFALWLHILSDHRNGWLPANPFVVLVSANVFVQPDKIDDFQLKRGVAIEQITKIRIVVADNDHLGMFQDSLHSRQHQF